jgi:hypothetical protein
VLFRSPDVSVRHGDSHWVREFPGGAMGYYRNRILGHTHGYRRIGRVFCCKKRIKVSRCLRNSYLSMVCGIRVRVELIRWPCGSQFFPINFLISDSVGFCLRFVARQFSVFSVTCPVDNCARSVISPGADSLSVGNQMLYHTPEEFSPPYLFLPAGKTPTLK